MRPTASTRPILLTCALALCTFQPASAYWMSDGGAMNLSIGAGNYLLSQEVMRGASSSNKSKKKQKAQKNPQAYQYRFSQSVSEQFADEFVQTMLAHAQSRGELTADVEKKIRGMKNWNFVSHYRDGIIARNGNPDSLATALAFWLAINYGTLHQVEGMGVDTKALQDQLETSMSQDKKLLAANDAEKQRMAENLLWRALVQIVIQEAAGHDAGARQTVAQQARDNLQSIGIDVDSMRIGKNGLQLQ